MNDRLAELQGDVPSWAQEDTAAMGDYNNGGAVDIEMGHTKKKKKQTKNDVDNNHTPSTNVAWAMDDNDAAAAADSSNNNTEGGQPEHMKQFFNDVEAIKSDISAVTSATEQITTLKDKAVLATSETEELQISDTIKTLVTDTNGRAKRCKNLLGLLKEENSNLKKEQKAKPTDLRVRENLVNTLLRKFIDEMKRYQNSQQQYKTDVKKKVTRQVQMIKPDATDQMFLDFALLTEQQGELLDQIEYQVRTAADYVEDANVDVYEAIEYQKKIRKKQCWIILIVVVLVLIILFSTGILKF